MAQLERVRDALHQQPFRSFEIRLLDGRSFLVKHPDFVAIPPSRRKRDTVVYDEAGVRVIDPARIQELALALEPEDGRRPKGK